MVKAGINGEVVYENSEFLIEVEGGKIFLTGKKIHPFLKGELKHGLTVEIEYNPHVGDFTVSTPSGHLGLCTVNGRPALSVGWGEVVQRT